MNAMVSLRSVFLAAASCLALHCASGQTARLDLAADFKRTSDFDAAALEYRRACSEAEDDSIRVTLLLLAADAYGRAGDWARMETMLDDAEDLGSADSDSSIVYQWLRMRQAEGSGQWASAALWGESAMRDSDGRLASAISRNTIADYLCAGNIEEAERIAGDMADNVAASQVSAYQMGSDKSPAVGGLLGIVPGMGYAYSGEWGNMVRSMLLNGLFGWAMIATARDDEWALFSAAAFFELTWYTGSIYGGIDAAHRYNRARFSSTVDAIRESEPVVEIGSKMPLLRLRLVF